MLKVYGIMETTDVSACAWSSMSMRAKMEQYGEGAKIGKHIAGGLHGATLLAELIDSDITLIRTFQRNHSRLVHHFADHPSDRYITSEFVSPHIPITNNSPA